MMTPTAVLLASLLAAGSAPARASSATPDSGALDTLRERLEKIQQQGGFVPPEDFAPVVGGAASPSSKEPPKGTPVQPQAQGSGHFTVGCGQGTFFLEQQSLGGQSNCQESLFYQIGRDFRISMNHQTDQYSDAIANAFGRSVESSDLSLRAKVLPWATLSAVLKSQAGTYGGKYDAQGYYLDMQNGSPFSSAPKLTVGTEQDSDRSSLKIVTLREKLNDVVLYGGYSSYDQYFSRTKASRTDTRTAGAIQFLLPSDQTMIVGYGEAADGSSSRLVGMSGAFSVPGSKNNEWFAMCRKRGAKDAYGKERATDHCMLHVALDGDGHYLFLVGEFFPGLLKSSKIVNNSNVTDARSAESHSLTEKPLWSFNLVHTSVEMTDSLSLVMDSVEVVHRLSGEAGPGNPYASLSLSNVQEPYFDYHGMTMKEAQKQMVTLAVGAGFDVFGGRTDGELAADYDTYAGTVSGVRLTFSKDF